MVIFIFFPFNNTDMVNHFDSVDSALHSALPKDNRTGRGRSCCEKLKDKTVQN
jgi:hypothetical protein